MKYSVNTTTRTLFETNNLAIAKSYAYNASRDCAPNTGYSPSIKDLDGVIVVYDNITATELASYNFTKDAIKSITKAGY